MKDMGKVMKLAKEKCGVSADGRDINEIFFCITLDIQVR